MTSQLSLEQIRKELQTALRQWANRTAAHRVFTTLTLFQQALRQANGRSAEATDRLLVDLLQALASENERYAFALRRRFADNLTAQAVAYEMDIAVSSFFNLQSAAIERLAALLYQQELAERERRRFAMEQLLEPPTYTELVGVDALIEQLLPPLMSPAAPWLFVLDGMGGLGKTSLANALMRRVIVNPLPFVNVGWVTARPSHFDLTGATVTAQPPALTSSALIEALWQQLCAAEAANAVLSHDQKQAMVHACLRQQPHLIVIDNLETLPDLQALLPRLQALQNPTKFLLTSRQRLGGGVGIFHFTVPALSAADALRLIRQEAALANSSPLLAATDAELQQIYATVGGNPLALRLVVGQAYFQPLQMILQDLHEARGAKVEQLYTYLYQRAWDQLDEAARQVWLAMPLVTAAGATVAYLGDQTELAEPLVRAALEPLVTLNLVNCHSDLHEPRFTIHNLTRTFLMNRIARWNV